MDILEKLFNASNSFEQLDLFIESNSIELYDFFISQKNSSIISHRKRIEDYILPKYGIYSNLDFADNKNQTFILCLLDVSERFGLLLEFQQLYNLAQLNGIGLNSRLRAAAKFLIGIITATDYENRINDIITDLSISFLKEEDNEQKTIATLINFYVEVFNNFGRQNTEFVVQFKEELLRKLNHEDHQFLLTKDVEEILSYSLENIDQLYSAVITKLDELLERSSQYLVFNIEPNLIESGNYAELLAKVSLSFDGIRNLCAELYSVVKSNEIFWSLQRGVKVLTEQNQLLAYLYCYGKMHYAKLMSALSPIKISEIEKNIEIYDWGCGQGLASVCFIEHTINMNIKSSINKITLIEPSEVALKRASLHIRKFNSTSQIITINKDLDSLILNDFDNDIDTTKIHLFSNILDIDLFSMNNLIMKIKGNFKGRNLFICASPYISEQKSQRIDDFVQSFENNLTFEIIFSISERNGEWSGTSWSRVIRVFKCIIE